MKKLITAKMFMLFILTSAMLMEINIPVFAYQYSFDSGIDYSDALGKPTSTDNIVVQNPESENIRRNKDTAYYPPPYGVFSGDIPTDQISLYHDNSKPYSGYTGNTSMSIVNLETKISGNVSSVSSLEYSSMLPPTSSNRSYDTQPLYYTDGSIGTLSIPKFNLAVKVYEGETLENMSIGAGHFTSTSAWNNNVAFAGHNRGKNAYFGRLKELVIGDSITYTTKYGKRTYQVYSKKKISNTDASCLDWTEDNILTLITCVADEPEYRLCIQANEIN